MQLICGVHGVGKTVFASKPLTAKECNIYTRSLTPGIDVGVYPPEFCMEENTVFINAYNLKEGQAEAVAEGICGYISKMCG